MKSVQCLIILCLLNISLFSQDANLEWAIGQGGTSNDEGNLITCDQFGNVYIIGTFKETVDFDPGPDVSSFYAYSTRSIFIQKLNSSGELIWIKAIGGWAGTDIKANSIDIDIFGNVLIAGYFSGGGYIDFDPGPEEVLLNAFTTVQYGFILKLNSNGDFNWVAEIKSSGAHNEAVSINTDAAGNIYTSGNFKGYVDFDPSDSSTYMYSVTPALFIQKLNPSGELIWVKIVKPEVAPNAIVKCHSSWLDNDGNICLIGDANGTIDFDPGPDIFDFSVSSIGNEDFVLKIDAEGNFVWAKKFGDATPLGTPFESHDIKTDNNNNIYITGYFANSFDFDPGIDTAILTSNGIADLFLVKLNSSGDFVWAINVGGIGSETGNAIHVDSQSNAYIIGFYNDTAGVDIDFDPGAGIANLTTIGSGDIFVLKLNSEGEFIWVEGMGGSAYDEGLSIYVDSDLNIYSTGFFEETVDFNPSEDSTIINSNGGKDIFIQKFFQDSCANFGISYDFVNSITCNELGSVSCNAFGGYPPYTYSWDINPIQFDSEISDIDSSGIYTVTVQDSIGCLRSSSVLVEGPIINGFDMGVNLVTQTFRPGFNSSVIIDAYNDGCVLTEGSITLVLDSLVSFIDTINIPDEIIGDTLIWNYNETNFDYPNIILSFETLTDSLAVIGDTVCFDLSISPFNGDADSSNNFMHYCLPIVNGYDPNDKKVYPSGICEGHFVLKTDPLTYTIRFQNTGNAEAINIHIIDSLSQYLDINTVEILGSSHDMYTLIRVDNVVDFKFDDIWLPDSTSNEEASHGYVIFKVYPNSFIYNGTFVDNKSEIYFDYNYPIETNTVFNTLVNVLLTCDINMGVDEKLNRVNDVLVYPNPSKGRITVDFGKLQNVELNIYNLSGQLIYAANNISTELYQFEVDEPAGIYLLEISSTSIKQYYKVVLE